MKFLEYDIKDDGAFAPFVSTMEDAGADIGGARVVFECDCSAAKMLADTLAEYGIIAPVMEGTMKWAKFHIDPTLGKDARKAKIESGDGESGDNLVDAVVASNRKGNPKPRKNQKDASANGTATATETKPAGDAQDQHVDKQGGTVKEEPNKSKVHDDIGKQIGKLGLDPELGGEIIALVVKQVDEMVGNDAKKYAKLVGNPMHLSKTVFGIIQQKLPDVYSKLKESGKISDKNENTASLTQKSELAKAISQIVGQVEVPDAFNVEIDDSEWDNALITSFGFPMINLTSPLVREMLRAQEPKAQKRAYKEFKKQLKADPDVAKALGLGVMGTLGLGGGKQDAATDKKARIDARTEGNATDGNALVEGPISRISNALKNPVDVLKSIAGNKGTPCHRNNLVVMYDEIDGKSGDSDESVTVIPLGVSGGVLVDKNKSVPVPMSHLAAFYSVVDPKGSFKSYAKAMAEVNTKSDNAKKGPLDAAAAAGKELLSKIPGFGRRARKELAAKESSGIAKAMEELAKYIKENGHPPFYLLKQKGEPKEVDRWSDEDAAHGYQMITMVVDGHKAGMIMKESTAKVLFKAG